MITIYITVAVIAYSLGSVPFGYLLVRTFRGEDIRRSGSGNIGATNVVRSGAKGLGLATLILDAAKGVLAVLLALALARSKYNLCGDFIEHSCVPELRLLCVAGLFAVLGHVFPIWLRFKGGKGVATAMGVFCILFPKAILVSLAIFIVAVALTRYVSLGSILGAIAFPIAAYFLHAPDAGSLAITSMIALLLVLKHHQNISRLLAGSENRLGGGKPAGAEKSL